MLKFLLIISLIVMEYETRNIYISGGFHYKGKGNSKIYVVKPEPPSQFNPIISECNRKKCVSDEVCYYYHKCCYESLCGHNICKRTCDETQDITIKETTSFSATEGTYSTSITPMVFTSTELEDPSTITKTTTTTLSTVGSTYNEPEETSTPSTSGITETTSPAVTTTVVSSTITDSTTSEGTSTLTTISPDTTTIVSSSIIENDNSGTSEDTFTITTTNSTPHISETTVANSTITPIIVSSTVIDRSGTSDSNDDLTDHTVTSSTIVVTSTLTTIQSTQTNEDVSTTVEIKTTNKYDDTSDDEGSGAITTTSPNVSKDDNITFVDEDENGSGSGDGIVIRHENRNQKIVKKEVESDDFIFIDSTAKPREEKRYFITDAISKIGDVTTISTHSTKSGSLQKNNKKYILEKEFFFDDNEDDTDDKYSGSGDPQDHHHDDDNFPNRGDKQDHVDGDYSGSGDDQDHQDGVDGKHSNNKINEEFYKNSKIKKNYKDFEDYLDVISSDLLGMNLTNVSDDYFIIVDGYDYSFGGEEKEVEDKEDNTV